MGKSRNMPQFASSQMPWSPWHERLHKHLRAQPGLLPEKTCLLLAVSGGQDSMALLKLMLDLKRLHFWDLKVWHGNHGWHAESSQIAYELSEWCAANNIEFYLDSTKQKQTKNESSAREWRYKQLILKASLISSNQPQVPCNHVLTGHTCSDRTETLILNLARGAALKGLSSLRKSRNLNKNLKLVRPLLLFSRAETSEICKELNLPVWIDPSNSNPAFSRNRIRQEVIPVLESLHPGCTQRISSLSERLESYADDQKTLALLALKTIRHPKGLCRIQLNNLSFTAKCILLARWLEEARVPHLSAAQLEELSKDLGPNKPPGLRTLSQGWEISWLRELIQLKNRNKG